jgi:hypothetical protein
VLNAKKAKAATAISSCVVGESTPLPMSCPYSYSWPSDPKPTASGSFPPAVTQQPGENGGV